VPRAPQSANLAQREPAHAQGVREISQSSGGDDCDADDDDEPDPNYAAQDTQLRIGCAAGFPPQTAAGMPRPHTRSKFPAK
jgi:hypothetical protein